MNKTTKKTTTKRKNLFTSTNQPKHNGHPKGQRNFNTIFRIVAREVADSLKLGKNPDAVQIEIVKRGIKETIKGNFNFYKDTIDRLYGKSPDTLKVEGDEIKKLSESIKKLSK